MRRLYSIAKVCTRYKLDKDGNNRLQSYRYESVNLIKTYEDFDPLKYITPKLVAHNI